MQHAIKEEITLATLTCCTCGVVFAMPDSLRSTLKRNRASFYCPNGHGQHFAENEVDRLRDENARLHVLIDESTRSKTQLADDYAKLQREHRRLSMRVEAGVCPCCNRMFQNLARHMASKHKGEQSR